ncbi:MAG: N-acetyltransferase [Chlorobi bacterium]|nr:N-acetyltransferase [Chlorobiota bacterium]MCI0715791.1 N-acetyltransferase [Chlorobiota bacterium]
MANKDYFVHPNALAESEDIGAKTRIWAFAHVMKNVKIGEDCNLCDYVFVESGVTIGNRVTVKNGISIWDGVTIEDDVFLGPYCVLTNDMLPRSKAHHAEYSKTLIKKGASIGANATILCGITLGRYCMVGAGAVVTKSIPDFALVTGNPARVKYWISKKGGKLNFNKEGIASDNSGNKYKLHNNKEDQSKSYVTEI